MNPLGRLLPYGSSEAAIAVLRNLTSQQASNKQPSRLAVVSAGVKVSQPMLIYSAS